MTRGRHSVEPYPIKSRDCDPAGYVHLHRLMDYAQDCDDRNCGLMGIDNQALLEKQAAWILIANTIRFFADAPASGDLLVIDSWSRGLKGIRFYRENRYYRNQAVTANLIGAASSEWILASTETHKPLRPASIIDLEDFQAMSDPSIANIEIIPRLLASHEAAPAPFSLQYQTGYGDLDFNGHMHNTNYTRLALDAAARRLDLDPGTHHLVVEAFHIQFVAETGYLETLQITASPDPTNPQSMAVEGRFPDRPDPSFLARLDYRVRQYQ